MPNDPDDTHGHAFGPWKDMAGNVLPGDIHTETAALIFGVPYSEVSPEQRREAKRRNFADMYGKRLTPEEAKALMDKCMTEPLQLTPNLWTLSDEQQYISRVHRKPKPLNEEES